MANVLSVYERDRAEKKLLMKLQEAEEAVKDGEGWLSLDKLKTFLEVSNDRLRSFKTS